MPRRSTIVLQCLRPGLFDEMYFAIASVLLGRGEALFSGLDTAGLGYRRAEHTRSARPRTSCFLARTKLDRTEALPLSITVK